MWIKCKRQCERPMYNFKIKYTTCIHCGGIQRFDVYVILLCIMKPKFDKLTLFQKLFAGRQRYFATLVDEGSCVSVYGRTRVYTRVYRTHAAVCPYCTYDHQKITDVGTFSFRWILPFWYFCLQTQYKARLALYCVFKQKYQKGFIHRKLRVWTSVILSQPRIQY